jgi:hypothetical protein
LAGASLSVAALCRSLGRPTEGLPAARRGREVLRSLHQPGPDDFYNLACAHALCGTLARLDPAPTSTGELAESRVHDDRAMEALLRAVRAGYRDAAHARSDADLDLLRRRADYQCLLMDMAFPPDPFAR